MGAIADAEKKLAHLNEVATHNLEEIRSLFVTGVKITLLVRHPSHPGGERDFVLTDDTPAEAMRAIEIQGKRAGVL